MLIDTCVVVDFLRGEERAKDFLQKTKNMKILVINLMEIMVGLPGKENKSKIDKLMESVGVEVVLINELISRRALEVLTNYRQKLGLDIADAFLAAAARTLGEEVGTLNIRHFKGIEGVVARRPYLSST